MPSQPSQQTSQDNQTVKGSQARKKAEKEIVFHKRLVIL